MPRPRKTAPPGETDLERLRRKYVDLADRYVDALLRATTVKGRDLPWQARVSLSTCAGIAMSKVLETTRYIEATADLPVDLPEDDEEARRLVKAALWKRTRTGSASAARELAAKLGLKNLKSQGIKVDFSRDVAKLMDGEDTADDPSA